MPKGKESLHHESSAGGVSKFATDYMFTGEDGTPITIQAGCHGVTKAFFANLVLCKGTSHGYAEREREYSQPTCCPLVIRKWYSTEPKNQASLTSTTKLARTSQPDVYQDMCHRRPTPTEASSESTEQSKDRFVQSRNSQNDRSLRPWALTAQC